MTSQPRNPYADLPPDAFWRSAVSGRTVETLGNIHRPKFAIGRTTKLAMAGSCFAQQLSRHLRARGFSVLDVEPPPPGLSPEQQKRYGFGLYSARHGNIYTARQFRQLAEEAFGHFAPADWIWEKAGRFYDALRPTVEPDGLSSARAVREQRKFHLRKVREVIGQAEVFVFTLGLTEAWMHATNETVYPTAPGVVSGEFDPTRHRLKNFTTQEIYADLCAVLALAKANNPDIKLLLTVSPQRPVATASGKHVLVAASYSKAALRAAAGQLESEHPDVDYFPSFEIATSPLAQNSYFKPNLRTVSDTGAAAAVNAFFAAYDTGPQAATPKPSSRETPDIDAARDAEDALCDEELLEMFSP